MLRNSSASIRKHASGSAHKRAPAVSRFDKRPALTPSPQRLPGIDALKALACMLIVWHHLAFYGPMSDVVQTAAPRLISWLYDYGRMAVQVFLVVGGFLAAAALASLQMDKPARPGQLILRRYRRLALPLVVAVIICVAVAAVVRPWFAHPSVPEAPGLWQLVAHVFFLQDLVGQEALSAGLWYVAIDFQLFVISVCLFTWVPKQWQRWTVLVLAAASLLVFNRHAGLDATALYFFGSYALGMMAWWASRSPRPVWWLLAIAVMGGVALALDFRGRLAVAMVVAIALVWLQPGRWTALQAPWLQQLGQISYSVFLIHFPVCLLVNALVSHVWPAQLLPNALGMLAAFVLSLLAGKALYVGVESRRWTRIAKP
ncbi:MAG: acyltransferase [Polaromonas sp.]|nr:acyltransferase [Polaromonas sp.]